MVVPFVGAVFGLLLSIVSYCAVTRVRFLRGRLLGPSRVWITLLGCISIGLVWLSTVLPPASWSMPRVQLIGLLGLDVAIVSLLTRISWFVPNVCR